MYLLTLPVLQVRLVRDLWDARSAAAEEAELAPRASREQLEEMSRRIKNANKNAGEGDRSTRGRAAQCSSSGLSESA
jgi:uncharacterized MAPEG superfamily protein